MSSTANAEIRIAAREAGVCLCQVAEACGVNDGNFSRKLRRELKPEEKDKILEIIRNLAAERTGVS